MNLRTARRALACFLLLAILYGSLGGSLASAGTDHFIGEIIITPFNFAPKGWAFCDGQLLPISQNTALFALLGTTYGGDGVTTFALPDLQGRVPIGAGQGPGLSDRHLGEMGGIAWVTLLQSDIPAHSHVYHVTAGAATSAVPGAGLVPATVEPTHRREFFIYADMGGGGIATEVTGGSLPHNNMQPYLALNYIIALQGIFPQRP